jgi:L-ribulose-5-phosphate 4-epimerase
MLEDRKRELIECARQMLRYGLVVLSGGNVSARVGPDAFLVTPSAMGYEAMVPDDIVMVDSLGSTMEGKRRPSSDTKALLYLFRAIPSANVILHTHQPYASAVGLVCDELPANQIPVIDELHGAVRVAPFARSSDEGMGALAAKYASGSLAVILRHHGALIWGKSIDQALSAAVYLEEASKTYLAALATGRPIPMLSAEQVADEGAERGYYGQPA